jgi:hypothetical protein
MSNLRGSIKRRNYSYNMHRMSNNIFNTQQTEHSIDCKLPKINLSPYRIAESSIIKNMEKFEENKTFMENRFKKNPQFEGEGLKNYDEYSKVKTAKDLKLNCNYNLPPKIPNYKPIVNRSKDIYKNYTTKNSFTDANKNDNFNTEPNMTKNEIISRKEVTIPSTLENVKKESDRIKQRLYSADHCKQNNTKTRSIIFNIENFHEKNEKIRKEKLLNSLETQEKYKDMYIERVGKFNDKKNEQINDLIQKEIFTNELKSKLNIENYMNYKTQMAEMHNKILNIQIKDIKLKQDKAKKDKQESREMINNIVIFQ